MPPTRPAGTAAVTARQSSAAVPARTGQSARAPRIAIRRGLHAENAGVVQARHRSNGRVASGPGRMFSYGVYDCVTYTSGSSNRFAHSSPSIMTAAAPGRDGGQRIHKRHSSQAGGVLFGGAGFSTAPIGTNYRRRRSSRYPHSSAHGFAAITTGDVHSGREKSVKILLRELLAVSGTRAAHLCRRRPYAMT